MRATLFFEDEKKLRRFMTKLKKLEGQKELLAQGRRWTREEAKKVLPRARANAPVKTGQLRRTLSVRVDKVPRGATAHKIATPTRKRLQTRVATGRGVNRVGRRTDLRIARAKGYYPAHVELGTRKMAARSYIRRAGESHEGAYKRNMRRRAKAAYLRALRTR